MARLYVSYGGDRSLPTHLRKNVKISRRNRYPYVGVPILFYPSVAVPILIAVAVSLNTLGLAGQKMRLQRLFCLPILPSKGVPTTVREWKQIPCRTLKESSA